MAAALVRWESVGAATLLLLLLLLPPALLLLLPLGCKAEGVGGVGGGGGVA
jgi:hypothetical protein